MPQGIETNSLIENCFIGYFDVLGFSTIIKHYNNLRSLARVIREDIIISAEIQAEISRIYLKTPEKQQIRYKHFSDTVIYYSAGSTESDFYSMVVCSMRFFTFALEAGFPTRGCITFGNLFIDENQLLSKEIIESYELQKEFDWAGVVVTQKCEDIIRNWKIYRQLMSSRNLIYYNVPKKSGAVNRYLTLNWSRHFKEEPLVRRCFTKKTGQKPDNRWEIERKIQNTIDFWRLYHSRAKTDSTKE